MNVEEVRSTLTLKSIGFEEIHFVRRECENKENTIGIRVADPKIDGDQFEVLVQAQVQGEGSYRLDVSLEAVFSIEGGLREENAFMLTNAVAIMFPYLRSEITLLTSQPGMNPVVLPPINVQEVMKKRNQQP